MKLLDPETGKEVGPGKKGVIHLKGPNVMKGYYKRPDKTAEVLTAGRLAEHGRPRDGDATRESCSILGRTKETIVLLGGENVEPVPIEDTILESEYIDQVMVVGQDQKFLAALVVPNDEALEKYAAAAGDRLRLTRRTCWRTRRSSSSSPTRSSPACAPSAASASSSGSSASSCCRSTSRRAWS